MYLMKSQSEFDTSLYWFCKEVGVLFDLIAHGFSAQKNPSFKRFCDQVGTLLKTLERATPWANRSELYIGLLKEAVRKHMRESNSPMVLWDYEIERRFLIHNSFPLLFSKLKGKHRMNALLAIKVTFLISVSLAGMNGFNIVILVPSQKIRRS